VNLHTFDLTISIVSYNTCEYLRSCLDSIYRNTDALKFEVIVVDNASHDDSVQMVQSEFPQVKIISNSDNRFFTRAHNQSLAIAQGRHFLILNSDTEIPSETLSRLVASLDNNPDIGAIGCRESNPDGGTEFTGSAFSTPWIEMLERTALSSVYRLRRPLWRYRMVDWSRDSSRDVDVLTDCFLMVRTELLKKFDGYDERFLLYYTENDLCLRIWQAGFRVHFEADCQYIHHSHRSVVQIGAKKYNRFYEQDMLAYYTKHFGKAQTWLMRTGFVVAQWIVAPGLRLYRTFRFGSSTKKSR